MRVYIQVAVGVLLAVLTLLLVAVGCTTPSVRRADVEHIPTPTRAATATAKPIADGTPDPLYGGASGPTLTFVPTPTSTPTPEPALLWDTTENIEASKASLLPLGIRVGAVFDPDPFFALMAACGGAVPIRDAIVAQFIPEERRWLDDDGRWGLRNDPNAPTNNVGPRIQVGFGQLVMDGQQFINFSLKLIADGSLHATKPHTPDVAVSGSIAEGCEVHVHKVRGV